MAVRRGGGDDAHPTLLGADNLPANGARPPSESSPLPSHRVAEGFLSTSLLHGAALPMALVVCATAVWLVSIRGLDPERMGVLGLITLLPPTFYVALGILAISFAIVVHRRESATAVLFLHVLLLTLIIRATPIVLYGTVRYAWTYKHVAIIDYIQRHGSLNRSIDYLSIYHNWPGFFAIGALLTQTAGLQTALTYANWAPVFFDLLAVPALLLIYRSFTSDRRLIWLGIWLFEIGNWVGQDYFSPQALGLTLFLYVIGLCLQWFGAEASPSGEAVGRRVWPTRMAAIWNALLRRGARDEGTPEPSTPLQRGALLSIAILLVFIIVSSHQLSPFMIISALTLLVVFRQCRVRVLLGFATALTVTWYLYAAEPYVRSQLNTILASLGDVTANLKAHSTGFRLPPDQQLVAHAAQGLTALVVLLALLGAMRRLRHGHRDLACILLVLAPAPLAVATHYGTEILFRVFLFALPFAAFLAAGLFYPDAGGARRRRHVALTALASMVLLAGLCVSYYGQEKMNYVSPAEAAAVQRFVQIAPPGSLLVQGSWDAPVPYHKYELYHYLSVQEMSNSVRRAMHRDPIGVLERQIHTFPDYSEAYLLVTRSQEAELRDIGLTPPHLMRGVQRAVARSSRFKTVFRSRDAALYLLVENLPRSEQPH